VAICGYILKKIPFRKPLAGRGPPTKTNLKPNDYRSNAYYRLICFVAWSFLIGEINLSHSINYKNTWLCIYRNDRIESSVCCLHY